MKKYIYITFIVFITFEIIVSNQQSKESMTLQEKHKYFLDNSPFRHSKGLSKKERKTLGIPPNKYYEDEWELTMNPKIGKPTPENLIDIQKDIMAGKYDIISSNKSVPGDVNNFWVERGPNNVGGRTKALLFDPNDLTNETVFAGGVSGGLWKNTNISNANSSWTLINDLANVSVSSITVDPLNPNIFYLGTGESYTNGDGVGNGVWKSTDRGTTWTHIFGGFDGAIRFESNALVTVNSPSTIAGDYPAIQASFGPALTTISGDLVWVNDGSSTPTLGCFNLTNASAISGKIAVIQRGSCLFVEKVRFAQNAGAKAVLMINNVSGEAISMGGSDANDIVIPAIMVSQADGLKITSAMINNIVNVTFNPRQSIASGIFLLPGKSHINDLIAVNNNGATEIYAAVGDSYYSGTSSPLTFFGSGDVGVYKSIDNGNNWTRMYLPPTPSGNFYVPLDLEYGSNNTLWVSTTYTVVNNDGGGTILSSTDHVNFIPKYSFSNGRRTELAISKSNPNLLYAVSHLSNFDTTTGERIAPFVSIVKTTDAFNTSSNLPLPNDAYSGIPDDDFTNSQSWFDLAIEVNPSNDQIVYIGGINWHKSINGGNSWSQFSNSYGGSQPNIHPDQHGLVFATPSILLIGNDGGVVYSSDGGSTLSHRNKNYNVTQFYHMAVAPTSYAVGEYFVAGAQDNGTQLFKNAISGIASSQETQSGDGAYCFFDQDGTDKYYISNYIYNQNIRLTKSNGSFYSINSEELENGDFICQQALDSKLNILYSNYSSGTNYSIRRFTITNLTSVPVITKTTLTNPLLTSSPTAFKVSPYTTTSTTLIVGLKTGKILKLNNANFTPNWIDISSPDMVGSISDIEFGSTEQELFVTIHNYGVKSIWYTSNGGTSWVNKEGNLPDMPVKCILRNPLRTEQVIIGTELGTWWTQNFSEVSPIWYYGSNGMNSVKVTNLEMRNDNKVYASTYGRGVFSGQFTSTDGTVVIDDLVTNTLTVYPNPASEFVNFNSKIELKKPQIQVFDLNNKLVAKYFSNSNSKSYKINVSNLNTGIYILRVTSDFQTFSSKIIVE